MSGAAAEGKAGICSLFVAWPSCFTGQYGREAHLTQNNILTDGKPNVISAVALAQTPGIYQLALLLSIWVFLWAIFRSVSVTEAGGKKWAKRPNLDVVDPKREARFIPVVSKYWPVPSQLTPLKPGFLCCTAKLSVLSVCSTQRCCCWQQRIKPDKQILILKHVVCWWIMIRCLDLFALFSKNEHFVLGFLYDE